jgi:hypothetical protein
MVYFQPKKTIEVYFGGPRNWKCFVDIWLIFPVLVCYSKKNLATLENSRFFLLLDVLYFQWAWTITCATDVIFLSLPICILYVKHNEFFLRNRDELLTRRVARWYMYCQTKKSQFG